MRAPATILVLMTLVLAGCVDGAIDSDSLERATAADAKPWQRVHLFDGERGPTDAPLALTFEVPEGAAVIEGVLTWRQPGAQLGFRLLDPQGEEAARGWDEAEGRSYVTTTHPVTPGVWVFQLSSARAIATPYAATITVHSDAQAYGPITTTFVIPPRNPMRDVPAEARSMLPSPLPRDFAEVNLNMVPGDTFSFEWTATRDVYFNVHHHAPDGTTDRPIEHRGRELQGRFEATETEVYALLWRNEGNEPAEVQFDMDGTYRLHSMTRQA